MPSVGAEAAWRGYRLQALDALWRILACADRDRLAFPLDGTVLNRGENSYERQVDVYCHG